MFMFRYYALMMHKCEELYWCVLGELIVCSKWKLNVRNYMSDFEKATMNASRDQFTKEGDPSIGVHVHIGCYFHWKQALRKYMISKIGFDNKEMVSRFLDIEILTIIPIDHIEIFGIPYLCKLFEGGITKFLALEIGGNGCRLYHLAARAFMTQVTN